MDDEPVAHMTGEEIAPKDASLEDLRERAKAYYLSELQGKNVRSAVLSKDVAFGRSRKALATSAHPDKLRMFAALRNVIAVAAPCTARTAR